MLFVRLVNPQRKIGTVNETDKFERSAKDLKLVSAIFLSNSKTMKNVFYFVRKALFVLEIFKCLYFHLPLFFSLSTIAVEIDPR